MNNKNFIIVSILLFLCSSISFAQVRIEVVPPFIEGGGSPSWNENRNTPNSVSEDVFELKNGSTIRGNLESFSGGVYFVNIGGITKSIPENSILKINGQFLSSVKATVPDSMTADVKIVKLDNNSLNLLFNWGYKENPNRVILKNNKVALDNDIYKGYYKIKGNDDFVIRQVKGAITSVQGGFAYASLIGKDKNQFCRISNGNVTIIPLKIDSEGVYCLASDLKKDKNTNVYFYRYGASNLEGPVAKCDNSFDSAEKWYYYANINKLGLSEIALISYLNYFSKGRNNYKVNKLVFYKSFQMNNGLFSFKPKYTYDFRKSPDNENTNEYIYINNGIDRSDILINSIGYGHFFNKTSNNWVVVYSNIRTHKITQKTDSELYIDVFDEDVSKGVAKSLHLICPPISFEYGALMVDIDGDGITEFVFKEYNRTNPTYSAIIVKLK